MTTGMEIRHHTGHQAAELRPLLLEVYTEFYATAAQTDPFASPERFADGLDNWSARPGWSCVVGYDGDQVVGYAYGAPLPEGARWWGRLLTDVPAGVTVENGIRIYALSELMVRTPWRKTGTARRLHSALLSPPRGTRHPPRRPDSSQGPRPVRELGMAEPRRPPPPHPRRTSPPRHAAASSAGQRL